MRLIISVLLAVLISLSLFAVVPSQTVPNKGAVQHLKENDLESFWAHNRWGYERVEFVLIRPTLSLWVIAREKDGKEEVVVIDSLQEMYLPEQLHRWRMRFLRLVVREQQSTDASPFFI